MSKSGFNLNGIQIGSIILSVIGILLVVFSFFTLMQSYVGNTTINGVDEYLFTINYLHAAQMMMAAIVVLIIALIATISSMRTKQGYS